MYRYGVDRYGSMVATDSPGAATATQEPAEPEQSAPPVESEEASTAPKLAPLQGPREFILTLEAADDALPTGGLTLVAAAEGDPAGEGGPQAGPRVIVASVALRAAAAEKSEPRASESAEEERPSLTLGLTTSPGDIAAARAAAEGSTILAINDRLLADVISELPPGDLAAAVARLIQQAPRPLALKLRRAPLPIHRHEGNGNSASVPLGSVPPALDALHDVRVSTIVPRLTDGTRRASASSTGFGVLSRTAEPSSAEDTRATMARALRELDSLRERGLPVVLVGMQTVVLPLVNPVAETDGGLLGIYEGLFPSSRRTHGHLMQCARTWWAFTAEIRVTLTRDASDGVFGLLPVCNGEDGGWIVCRALPGSAAAASGVPVQRNSVLTRVNGVDVGPAAHRLIGGVPSEPEPRASRVSWKADVMPLLVEAGTTCEICLV